MKKSMELNKETASRLWVQQFGKKQKAIDFSGREIAKAAYNDRNSAYGWNVDHILPQSKGGKTADYNLICCHIMTNDEKADKFPCFIANARGFEIQKRQNHYEIIARTADQVADEESDNFLDAAQGLRCWRQCKPRKEGVFAGYVKIRVEVSNEVGDAEQLFDRYGKFLSELFGTESIFAENANGYVSIYGAFGRTCVFTVIVVNIPTKDDTQNFLDDCVILNTYNDYFKRKNIFNSTQIVCGMRCYKNDFEMYSKCKGDIIDKRVMFADSLMIDELVKCNTSAEKELKVAFSQGELYPYNVVFKKLEKDLGKRI